MTTTWTIAIDWDRDGSFTTQYDDVTADVISARWFLGQRNPYQDNNSIIAFKPSKINRRN